MQSRISVAKMLNFELLNRLDCGRGYKMHLIGNIRKFFKRIQKQCAMTAPSSSDVRPVTTFPSGSSIAAAGKSVTSALISAAPATGRSFMFMPAFFIKSSSFITTSLSQLPAPFPTYTKRGIIPAQYPLF